MRLDIRIGGAAVAAAALFTSGSQAQPLPLRGPAASAPLYVAPQGSDSGQCSQAQPCQSIDRAYHLAQPGQSVQLAGGDYPEQVVLYDAAKEGARLNVVVRPTPGAQVRLQQLTIGPDRTTRGATHLEVQGVTILQDVAIHGCGATVEGSECVTDSGGNYIVLRQLNILGPYGFFCASCDHVSLLDSRVGPLSYGSPCNGSAHPEVANEYDSITGAKLKRANHLLFQRDKFENFSRCTSTDHTECLQIEPADDVIIRDSTFQHCDTMDVNLANDLAGNSHSAAGYRAPNDVLIENNYFAPATDLTGGQTFYALNIRECTNCIVRYNSWLQSPRMPSGEISLGNRFVGNLGPMPDYNCLQTGMEYSHNVWLGAKCGQTDKRVKSLGFVNPESLDLHLLGTSPAIGAGDAADRPTTDIDAQARPLRAPPDAGADQREPGAIVPGRSIGSVTVGMTKGAVTALYGQPTRVLQRSSASGIARASVETRTVYYRIHRAGLWISYSGPRVTRITTTSAFYSTDAGLGPGSSVPSVTLLGKATKCPGTYRRAVGAAVVEFTTRTARGRAVITGVAVGKRAASAC